MQTFIKPLPLPVVEANGAFQLDVLELHSSCLQKNPLGDSPVRSHYVLSPKEEGVWPVIFHFAGYYGNGPYNFHQKTLEENFVDLILRLSDEGTIPQAVHVFVDAMSGVGGSQFINSAGCGAYADHILKELVPTLQESYCLREDKKHWAVMGASSGGYGALYHVSQKNSPFGIAMAIAPDSFFEGSLLPELRSMAPYLSKYKRLSVIKKAIKEKEIQKHKKSFYLTNAIAMSICYAQITSGEIKYPIDLKTGELNKTVWRHWKKSDPVVFLQKNKAHLKTATICLDVGIYDEFGLYFGTRQIHDVLKKNKVSCVYSEFEGGHFKLNARKELVLRWLKRQWK